MSCEFCPTGYPVCPECIGALVARQDQLEASILALVAELAHERARSWDIAEAERDLRIALVGNAEHGVSLPRVRIARLAEERLRALGVEP